MIRFQRVGRKNDPAFRVVVTEKRSKPKSGGVEILGSYHPKTKEAALKNERILYWISKGAKLSPTVQNLLISKGVITGAKIHVVKRLAVQSDTKETVAVEAPAVTEDKIEEKSVETQVKDEVAATAVS